MPGGQEWEEKVLDVDPAAMRKLLLSHGCKRVHAPKMLKRNVYLLCDKTANGFGRVRDDGDGVSMTVKSYEKSKNYPEEFEVQIKDSFEVGSAFMESIGLSKKAYQESIREKWSHPMAHEIVIDIVPGLPPYMEVDCDTEEKLHKLKKLFKMDESKVRTGAYGKTYEEYYGIPERVINKETPFLTFKDISKQIHPTKNQDLLKKLQASYKGDYVNTLYGYKGKTRQTRKAKKE